MRTAVEKTVRLTIGAPPCPTDMLGIPNGIIASLNQVRKKNNFVDTLRTKSFCSNFCKDKSPVVPFLEVTLQYS